MEYSETVLEHFRAPRNLGEFAPGTPQVWVGTAGTRRHGREIRVQLKLGADGRIEACRYRVYGCPATVALCSVMSTKLAGLTPLEARALSAVPLTEELGLPATKRDAALIFEDAVRAALAGYNMDATEDRRASA